MGRRSNGAFGMAEATPWRDNTSAYFAALISALPTWRAHAPAQAGTPVPSMRVGSMEPTRMLGTGVPAWAGAWARQVGRALIRAAKYADVLSRQGVASAMPKAPLLLLPMAIFAALHRVAKRPGRGFRNPGQPCPDGDLCHDNMQTSVGVA